MLFKLKCILLPNRYYLSILLLISLTPHCLFSKCSQQTLLGVLVKNADSWGPNSRPVETTTLWPWILMFGPGAKT